MNMQCIPYCRSPLRPEADDQVTTWAHIPRGCGPGTCVQGELGYDDPTAVYWGPCSLSKECLRSTRESSLEPSGHWGCMFFSLQLRPRSERGQIGYRQRGTGPEWMQEERGWNLNIFASAWCIELYNNCNSQIKGTYSFWPGDRCDGITFIYQVAQFRHLQEHVHDRKRSNIEVYK